MKLYLAPSSSLELTRYLRAVNAEDGLGGIPTRKRAISDAMNRRHDFDELDATAQLWLSHASEPLHVFVGDRTKGTRTNRLITHVLGSVAPHGAFLDIGHGVCICSPRFAFMRMAKDLDLIDSILVGMELCGAYSRWRIAPGIMGDPYYSEYPETRGSTYDLPKAMSLARTVSFVERQQGQPGAVGARAALRWVLDNSASPMETAIYLLLCLPKRLGGYGLPQPVLNPKVVVSTPEGKKDRYPDLFWPGPNIDVEYNSDKDHSGEWSRYRDSKREIELTVASVSVLPLTRPQVFSTSDFDSFANGLRKMLGIRARREDAAWTARRDELRHRLLFS